MSKIIEKDFFSYLQNQSIKNDFILLNSQYIPNKLSNKLNRFYDDSIWYSRLKISDKKSIYYFGLNDDITQEIVSPNLILKFDSSINKSTIRFSKDDVLLLIKIQRNSECFNILNKSFKILHATKNKDSNLFYLNLGSIENDEFINNIKFLITTFNFNLDITKKELSIININIDFTNLDKIIYNNLLFDTLRFNLKVIEIKNIIYNLNFNNDVLKWIDEYLFTKNENGDYCFNFEVDKSDISIFNSLKLRLSNLNSQLDYNSIINIIKNDLNK